MNNNIPTDPVVKAGFIINEIVRIIELPGEEYTDGECLDLMIQLLEKNGYEFNFKAFSYRGHQAKQQEITMENEEEQETQNSKFENQVGYDDLALTRKEIMESRGYND